MPQTFLRHLVLTVSAEGNTANFAHSEQEDQEFLLTQLPVWNPPASSQSFGEKSHVCPLGGLLFLGYPPNTQEFVYLCGVSVWAPSPLYMEYLPLTHLSDGTCWALESQTWPPANSNRGSKTVSYPEATEIQSGLKL